MRKSRKNSNSRRKGTGPRPYLALLVTVVVIVALLAGLEMLKRSRSSDQAVPSAGSQPAPVARAPIPAREQMAPEPYRDFTTVHPPSGRKPVATRKKMKGPGTVAIIIDDMGSSVAEVKAFMAIAVPLTFSVIPGLAKDREVAEAAHAGGYEVMMHLPMEPQDYPARRLEANGLLVAHSGEELVKRLENLRREVPYVVGANNHMGSRFTENEEKMRVVLGELKRDGLFFVDSMTTPSSVGIRLARELGMESAARNVFLDNVQNSDAVREQLYKLAALARRRGSAIGICHPHQATIKALSTTLPDLKSSGINFVYASELVR